MSEHDIVEIGFGQLKEILGQLEHNLSELKAGDPRVKAAVEQMLKKLDEVISELGGTTPQDRPHKIAMPFDQAQDISHNLVFLRLANQQRSDPEMSEFLAQIDELIQSCYQPITDILPQDRLEIRSEEILSVYFQDEYLARPSLPVPYLLVPNYFEGDKPEEWMGIGHETGHHVYRQVRGLREEIEVATIQAMRKKPVPLIQQRLWFHWLEEIFADLYGILTLGAAFVYTQHMIILYAGSPEAYWPIHDQPRNDDASRYLQGLLEGQDLTHPISLIRGKIGLYIYEKLLGLPSPPGTDLNALIEQWNEKTRVLTNRPLRDPHTPKFPFLTDAWNKDNDDLDQAETEEVMKLVVDALLDTKFCTLGGCSLSELVNFNGDEESRQNAVLEPGGKPLHKPTVDRIYVAAQRLAKHKRKLN